MGKVIDFKSRKKQVTGVTVTATVQLPEGFHTYTKAEVEEANRHPFVLAMRLKLHYTGWCIFVDKEDKTLSMRSSPQWLFTLKPAGIGLIHDIKEALRYFKLSKVKNE